jgi:hypothetical protein
VNVPQENHFDVIIIGTGAGGGTLAYRIAPSGKRILLLERGGYLPREKDNWDPGAVFLESKYRAKETWYDKDGNTFHPGIQYYVGGNTKVYGAALLRFRQEDFGEVRAGGRERPRVVAVHQASFTPRQQFGLGWGGGGGKWREGTIGIPIIDPRDNLSLVVGRNVFDASQMPPMNARILQRRPEPSECTRKTVLNVCLFVQASDPFWTDMLFPSA